MTATPSPIALAPTRAVAPRPDSGLCYPDCPYCRGVGYVRYDVPLEDPRFGRLEMCPNARRRALETSLARGEIDPRVGLSANEIREMTWNMVRDGVNDAPLARRALQDAYETGYGLVFLYGASGQAKTLLLKIAVATAFRDGKTAAYADMRAVLDDVRLAYDERENKQSELARRMEWWSRAKCWQ